MTETANDPVAAPAGRFATVASFAFREYRLLFAGTLFSALGWWCVNVPSVFLVQRLTDSAFLLGMVGFLTSAPMLLFSPFAGTLADRFDRRKMLLIIRAITVVPPLVLALLTLTDLVQVWHVLLVTGIMGTAQAFDLPARHSLIPNAVPRSYLMNAYSLHAANLSATQILGPSLAGGLLTFVPEWLPLGLASLSFVIVLVCVTALRYRDIERTPPGGSALQQVIEGLRFAIRHPVIRVMVLLGMLVGFLAQPYFAMLPKLANDVFQVGPAGYGAMTAAAGIGALVGTLGLASLTTTRYQTLLVMLAAGVLGLALLGLGLAPGFAFALIMMLVIGAGSTGTQALFNTVIQSNVNDAMRGRMTSLYIVTFGVSAFGSLLIGAVADVIGVALAVAGAGALTTLAAILTFLLSPSLRRRSTAES